jgi:hypothetical protein
MKASAGADMEDEDNEVKPYISKFASVSDEEDM